MYKFIIALSFLVIASNITAQESKRKSFFHAEVGGGYPVGNFGNVNDSTGNFAKVGYQFGISAEHILFKYIGVKATYNFAMNGFRKKTYERNMKFPEVDESGASTTNETSFQASSQRYMSNSLLAGVFLNYPVENVSFGLEALYGPAITRYPESTRAKRVSDGETSGLVESFTNDKTNGFSWAFNTAFHIRYNINDGYYIFRVGYYNTTTNYSNVNITREYVENGNALENNYQADTKLTYEIITLSIGVGISL